MPAVFTNSYAFRLLFWRQVQCDPSFSHVLFIWSEVKRDLLTTCIEWRSIIDPLLLRSVLIRSPIMDQISKELHILELVFAKTNIFLWEQLICSLVFYVDLVSFKNVSVSRGFIELIDVSVCSYFTSFFSFFSETFRTECIVLCEWRRKRSRIRRIVSNSKRRCKSSKRGIILKETFVCIKSYQFLFSLAKLLFTSLLVLLEVVWMFYDFCAWKGRTWLLLINTETLLYVWVIVFF